MILRNSLRPNLDADVLDFHGELDMLSATELQAALAETLSAGAGDLLIDLTHCVFVDSTGLAALVDGDRALQEDGRAVVIVARNPGVRRTLALTGVEDLIEVCFSREEAEQRLAAD